MPEPQEMVTSNRGIASKQMSLLCHLHAEHSARQSEHPVQGALPGAHARAHPAPRAAAAAAGGEGQPGTEAGVRSRQTERMARMKQDREPRAPGWRLARRCHRHSRSEDLFTRFGWPGAGALPGRTSLAATSGTLAPAPASLPSSALLARPLGAPGARGLFRASRAPPPGGCAGGAGPRGERLTLNGCGETPAVNPMGTAGFRGVGPLVATGDTRSAVLQTWRRLGSAEALALSP